MAPAKSTKQLKMRLFAGPNGSGKSTVIGMLRNTQIKRRLIDFGVYVNADDIAEDLRNDGFYLNSEIRTTADEFCEIIFASGLVSEERYSSSEFLNAFLFENNGRIRLQQGSSEVLLAQAIAHFLREKLVQHKSRLSFETVFSNQSKLEFMKMAKDNGYVVYLYFVSTDSPKINLSRVKSRVAKNGHDVPPEKTLSRYFRTMNFLYEACQLADQVYFFDNSKDVENNTSALPRLFASFKVFEGSKVWSSVDESNVPEWFLKYYIAKIGT